MKTFQGFLVSTVRAFFIDFVAKRWSNFDVIIYAPFLNDHNQPLLTCAKTSLKLITNKVIKWKVLLSNWMRQSQIEPEFIAWKATMLTITTLTLCVESNFNRTWPIINRRKILYSFFHSNSLSIFTLFLSLKY